MQNHPIIAQLIDAQIDFLQQELTQPAHLQAEIQAFFAWLHQQKLGQIWDLAQIQQLAQQQVLNTPVSDGLIEQIAEHIRFAIIHPVNDSTPIEQLLPEGSVDQLAKYIASKTSHRQQLIQKVVNNPAFNKLLAQLIQNAIQDYMDNGLLAKKVPGVGRFMKMGKSMLESVTDSNLEDTVGHYLHKNIRKISQMSEQLLNQYFDDERLYQLQTSVWHKVKGMPVSAVRQYVVLDDIHDVVALGRSIWEHLRQSEFLQQHVQDGVATWYARNQERSMQDILRDINIDDALITGSLGEMIASVITPLLKADATKARARQTLAKFYDTPEIRALLKLQQY